MNSDEIDFSTFIETSSTTKEICSVLSMPDAPLQPWIKAAPSAHQGKISSFQSASAILGNNRTVLLYTPSPLVAGSLSRLPVLLVFDGPTALYSMKMKETLDNLIAAQKIPPMVGVFVDNVSRREELPCNKLFVRYLAEELLPEVDRLISISNDPKDIITCGASFGALAAIFSAICRPDVFGKVIAQSTSFQWRPKDSNEYNFLLSELRKLKKFDVELYMECGEYEDWETDSPETLSILHGSRAAADLLRLKATHRFEYREFKGAHDYACWRGGVADGLIWLYEKASL